MNRQTEALAGYLDTIDFDYFCTFTTRKPVSIPATRRIAERVAGTVYAGDSTSMFWAAEKFDVREGFHFHALLKVHDLKYITPTSIWAWYYPRFGRCQVINNTDVERRQAASVYCAKYITKELADYDIYLPGMKSPPGRNPLDF